MKTTILARSWSDAHVSEVASDCMLKVADGVYYHVRLDRFYMIRDEMPESVALMLGYC
jgi:hypothetical protein